MLTISPKPKICHGMGFYIHLATIIYTSVIQEIALQISEERCMLSARHLQGHWSSFQQDNITSYYSTCKTWQRKKVDFFGTWCVSSHLILNVKKTKEKMDFRMTRNKSNSVMMGEEVGVAEEYIYIPWCYPEVCFRKRVMWKLSLNSWKLRGSFLSTTRTIYNDSLK